MKAERFWTRAYQRNIGKMIGVNCRYVGDRAIAEDLAHDAFLKAIEKSKSYRHLGSFEGWLMRVNLNNTLDYLRRQPQFLSIEETDLPECTGIDEVMDKGEQLLAEDFTEEDILEAIGRLSDKQRMVFNLYVFENQKHPDISKMLGIGVRSSKRYLSEARVRLQHLLNEKKQCKKSSIMVILLLISRKGHAIDRLFYAKLGHLTLAPTASSPLGALNWAAAPKPSVWMAISAAKAPTIASLSGVSVAVAVAGSVAVWQSQSSDPASHSVPTHPVLSQTIAAPDTIMEDIIPMSTLNNGTVGIPVETPCIASLPNPDRVIQTEPTEPPSPETPKVTVGTSSNNHSLHKFLQNGYFGLADEQGNVVLQALYSNIEPFDEYRSGWAMVDQFGFKGFVDSSGIVASGNAVTKEFIHKPFTTVNINFIGNVVIRYGNHHKTEITTDDNIIEHVIIQVADGKLSICMDDNFSYEKASLRVDISTPHLKELTMRGTCDVRIEPRTEPQLAISKSGTGDCIVNCVKIEESLEIHNNGTGDVIIPRDGPLKAKSLFINNPGVGDITINASSIDGSLTISNPGTGDVKVNLMGIPTEDISLQNNGTGDIRIQNMLGKSVKVKNLGTGEVILNGKATSQRLVNHGSGDINALSLETETSHITNYGVGDVKAKVTGTAYVTNQSHVGKVNIIGGGKVVWE